MKTTTLALVSTMLIGLGGAAFAQEATEAAQEPILEPDEAEVLQQTQDAPPEVMEDTDALAPEQGVIGEMLGERSPSVAMAPGPYAETVLGGLSADELIGMDVVDAAGERVGSVVDFLIGAEQTVDRAIIDVGGFLGSGGKPVALDLDRLTIAEGDGEVVVDITREELDAMPEWQQADDGWFSN